VAARKSSPSRKSDIQRGTAARQFGQRAAYLFGQGGIVVVADPGIEQVAQDVQGIGPAGAFVQEAQEQRQRVRALRRQVQVGDEQLLGHAGAPRVVSR
jgi:hypothetical protein